MKRIILLSASLLISVCINSCKKSLPEQREKISLIYLIVDKTSNFYSDNGGIEENYIKVDSSYIEQFVNNLFFNQNRNDKKSKLIIFCNFIDEDVKGNKELYIELPYIQPIDTIYKPKGGQIISTKEDFYKDVEKKKQDIKLLEKKYHADLDKFIKDVEGILYKSSKADKSDCFGALNVANKKLNTFFINENLYDVDKKLIITFSDLVNSGDSKLDEINNKVIRPGYTSNVNYLNDTILINTTSQDEFEDFLYSYLGYDVLTN